MQIPLTYPGQPNSKKATDENPIPDYLEGDLNQIRQRHRALAAQQAEFLKGLITDWREKIAARKDNPFPTKDEAAQLGKLASSYKIMDELSREH